MKFKKYQYDSAESVEEKYRWDLESVLENKSVDFYLEELKTLSQKLIELKEKKYESKELYLENRQIKKQFNKYVEILGVYLSNRLSTNIVNPEFNREIYALQLFLNQHSMAYGTDTKLLEKHKDKVLKWAQDPEFEHYRHKIIFDIDSLKYRYEDRVENYLIQTQKGNINLEKIFGILHDSDIEYGHVKVDKQNIKITDGNYTQLLKHKDEKVRKKVFNNRAKAYYQFRQTFSSLLIQFLKNNSENAKFRGFKSLVESEIYSDQIPVSLLEQLYKNVQKLAPIFQKFVHYRRAFFKKKYNKEMKPWDGHLPLVEETKTFYTVEEAQEILIESLEEMPQDYREVMVKALREERWVDYMNYPNKRSGAYSVPTFHSPKKFMLMNYDGDIRSVLTLAHEFGHSMHTHFATTKQPVETAYYPIILAEIASVFQEIFVYNFLIKKHQDHPETVFSILDNYILEIIGVVQRQAYWSNYEFEVRRQLEEDKPITTFEDLDKINFEVVTKYFLDIKKNKWAKEIHVQNGAFFVPHFYYDFYVYKYALGFMIACQFFDKFKKEGQPALRNYIDNFLSAGSKKWPVELLKDAGVDVLSEQLFSSTHALIESLVDQFIQIGQKIFNLSEEEKPKLKAKKQKNS